MKPWGKRGGALLAVLFILIEGIGLNAAPVSAHNTPVDKSGGHPYNAENGCVGGYAFQDHGDWPGVRAISRYVLVQSYYGGWSGSQCNGTLRPLGPGQLNVSGAVYKNGAPCIIGGWVGNSAHTHSFGWSTNENLYPACNNGPGSTVYITHDTVHAVWNWWEPGERYHNGFTMLFYNAPYPSTGHTHTGY